MNCLAWLSLIVFSIFLYLKLAGIGQVALWGWVWITAPLWIYCSIILLFLIVLVLITILIATMD